MVCDVKCDFDLDKLQFKKANKKSEQLCARLVLKYQQGAQQLELTMKKLVRLKQLNRNHFFLIGFAVGLVLTICMPDHAWQIAEQECPETVTGNDPNRMQPSADDFEPRLNLINKPMAAKKMAKNIIRPRYYSSELGIREKLFLGVMTTQNNINTLATAFNRTAAHLIDKIKYFINAADNVRTNFQLKNIVGFTDARDHLKPFHVLKYIADNYLDEYDFFSADDRQHVRECAKIDGKIESH